MQLNHFECGQLVAYLASHVPMAAGWFDKMRETMPELYSKIEGKLFTVPEEPQVDGVPQRVIRIVRREYWTNGASRLQAIKQLRAEMGWGLKESKDWVDQHESLLREDGGEEGGTLARSL